jgi:amidophosphoribosyltransferase
MGLVNQVFSEKILSVLRGWAASGHVRYSTTGSSNEANAQPVFLASNGFELAVSHNGNLINTKSLKDMLASEGYHFEASNDSELIARLIHSRASGDTIIPALYKTLPMLKGAFSLIIQTSHKIIGVRDAFGVRPLCIGQFDGNYVLSSETCGLDIIGAKFEREVEPGEFVVIDKNGVHSHKWTKETRETICIFEYIYFARPDSYLGGKLLHTCRQRLGANLAKEVGDKGADFVVSVPDSGTPHAIGVATELKLSFQEGLIKNRYVGRTFINPHQKQREIGIRMKLNPLRDVLEGKKVLLVDDSIVRGNTSSQIVDLIRRVGGAKEVHMMVCSPPVKYPCYYGIDMAAREELVAANKNLDELKAFLGADSVNYLSIEGMMDATGLSLDHACMACFAGTYPIPFTAQMRMEYSKLMLEQKDPAITGSCE